MVMAEMKNGGGKSNCKLIRQCEHNANALKRNSMSTRRSKLSGKFTSSLPLYYNKNHLWPLQLLSSFHLMSWNSGTLLVRNTLGLESLYSRPRGLDLFWFYTAWRELGHQHQWYIHQHTLQDLPSIPLGQLGASCRHRECQAHTAPCCHPPRHWAARKGNIGLCTACKGTHYTCSHQHSGSACDLTGLCTTNLRICVHPNPHCISLLRSIWNC